MSGKESDYLKYRGKCKEMSEALIKENPDLVLVRGYYFCPIWNKKEQHWWVKDKNGVIHDPSKNQFLSKGMGIYREFDGNCECSECGKTFKEDDPSAYFESRYCFCSYTCYGHFVGF